LEAPVTPREHLHRDYSLLTGFLRRLSFRLQLRRFLEFLLLLPSVFIVILLGSLFVIKLKEAFPTLSFASGALLSSLSFWKG
jgi:hypothetical protein